MLTMNELLWLWIKVRLGLVNKEWLCSVEKPKVIYLKV